MLWSEEQRSLFRWGVLLFTCSHALDIFFLISKPRDELESVQIISPKSGFQDTPPAHRWMPPPSNCNPAPSSLPRVTQAASKWFCRARQASQKTWSCLFKQLRPCVCVCVCVCVCFCGPVQGVMVSCVHFPYQWPRRLLPDGRTYFKATFLCRRKTVWPPSK